MSARLPRGLSAGGPSGILEIDCSMQLHISVLQDCPSACRRTRPTPPYCSLLGWNIAHMLTFLWRFIPEH